MNLPSWVNWTNFLAVWAALYALATLTQNVAKEGSGYWKFCHAVLGLSPGDFVKVFKTIGTSFVPPTMAVLFVLALPTFGCSSTPAPQMVSRATARAAVDVAKDAWVTASDVCKAAGTADPAVGAKCAEPLDVAHDLIVASALAVDTNWDGNAACSLAKATLLVSTAATFVPVSASGLTLIKDADDMAKSVLGSSVCATSDGGGE